MVLADFLLRRGTQRSACSDELLKKQARYHTLFAVYDDNNRAQAGLSGLQHAGHDMRQVSAAALKFQPNPDWPASLAQASLTIPGLGTVAILGPLAAGVSAALQRLPCNAAHNAFSAAVADQGLPLNTAARCEVAVKSGQSLVFTHGPTYATTRTLDLLETEGPTQIGYFLS